MNRRDFVKMLAAVPAVFAALPGKLSAAAPSLWPPNLDVAAIIRASYPSVIKDKCRGNAWASPKLNAAVARGEITVMSLGHQVQVGGQIYPVQELSIPLRWSAADNSQPLEHQRIAFAATLLDNAISSHDDLMEDLARNHTLIVSREYRYGRGAIMEMPKHGRYCCVLYTAYVAVPKTV